MEGSRAGGLCVRLSCSVLAAAEVSSRSAGLLIQGVGVNGWREVEMPGCWCSKQLAPVVLSIKALAAPSEWGSAFCCCKCSNGSRGLVCFGFGSVQRRCQLFFESSLSRVRCFRLSRLVRSLTLRERSRMTIKRWEK